MEKLRENFEVDVKWRAFPLHPDTPEEGLALIELYAGRNLDPCEVMARQKRAAAEAGLPMGERTKTYNSRLATELGKWAEGKGKGAEFHKAVFRAYYVDGINIAKADKLIELAETAGLSGREAAEVLKARAFREAVDTDWELAGRLGISAVPTFVLDGWAVVGAQPY
ncbi:MAG: DsbA family protein, partial [Proteobacteria bacterium]|nr:DsbA family protein [Pseudomonadota bacterium]